MYLFFLLVAVVSVKPTIQNPAGVIYPEEVNVCIDGPDLIWYVMMPEQSEMLNSMGPDSLTRLFTLVDPSVDNFREVNSTVFANFWQACTNMYDDDTEVIFKLFAEAADDDRKDVVTPEDLVAIWSSLFDPDGDGSVTGDEYIDIWIEEIIPNLNHNACPDEMSFITGTMKFHPVCSRFMAGGF